MVVAEAKKAAAAAAELIFKELRLPQQRLYDGIVFPLILSPNTNIKIPPSTNFHNSVSSFPEAVRTHKSWLEDRLHDAGAILFRGFHVDSAEDFNEVVEAFDFEELPYIGGAAPRNKVVGRVFTANESPPDQKIPFHHEMAQVLEFPSKLFFFCDIEPASGGETAIVLSHIIYQRMKDKYPEFVQQLEEHGLIYTRVLSEDDDNSSPIGRGWKSTFLTDDRKIAEERASKIGTRLEWLGDIVKSVMGPIPAIRIDKSRQRKVWFNSMVIAYTSYDDARNDPTKAVQFGDGRPVPGDIVLDCVRILDEESVAIPWQKGDVLLIDNWAILHSRRSFVPPRRILASLCK
ncbi:Clavaminate synthase-like protein [Drosera capensis]